MIYLLAILFFVPESLSIARQLKARERWDEEESSRGGWRPWNFLRPLALLGKKKVEAEGEEGPVLWSKKAEGGRDVGVKEEEQRSWALTKIAVGYAGYVFVIVSLLSLFFGGGIRDTELTCFVDIGYRCFQNPSVDLFLMVS